MSRQTIAIGDVVEFCGDLPDTVVTVWGGSKALVLESAENGNFWLLMLPSRCVVEWDPSDWKTIAAA
jgi:hypothetical protein